MAAIVKQKNRFNSKERSLEEQLRYQKKLNNITNKIHSARDTNDILFNLQEEILSIFEADRITIYVVDGVKKQVVSRFMTGDEIKEIRVPVDVQSIAGFCAASGRMINIVDAYNDKELKRLNPELKFFSMPVVRMSGIILR